VSGERLLIQFRTIDHDAVVGSPAGNNQTEDLMKTTNKMLKRGAAARSVLLGRNERMQRVLRHVFLELHRLQGVVTLTLKPGPGRE
jgi:hypothetical protein